MTVAISLPVFPLVVATDPVLVLAGSSLPLIAAIDPVLIVVALVPILAVLAVTVGPLYVADRYRTTRDPTRAERAQLDELRSAAGLDVEPAAILESDGSSGSAADETASVEISVRGPPGRRVLFVSEAVLSSLDEDTAVALLAAEAGRLGTRYTEVRAFGIAGVTTILAAIVTTLVPFEAGFTAIAVVGVVSLWAGRRVQYAADERAADRVGSSRLADAFEQMADRRGVVPERGDWRTWFEVQPPLGDRIDRLRDRGGA
ncbi:STE24 endopeptidase [Halopenitus malekzadehii]|uniref:STE24 endopeptidase n=1 Tax=Halopenitus malekzadehii TaxID=1267564 RepID=A0A1H6HRM3_9EURY|nr:peptidase [Halopenitus malekzadehii]SEH38470.1 STE24 endopeptidase [Halopenitus malekzadehii]